MSKSQSVLNYFPAIFLMDSPSHFLKWLFGIICSPQISQTSSSCFSFSWWPGFFCHWEDRSHQQDTYLCSHYQIYKPTCIIPPSLYNRGNIPSFPVKTNSFTFHWILFLVFCLLQDFLLSLIPSPCVIDLFLTINLVCKNKPKTLGLSFFSNVCSIPISLVITL